jgi:hypothetical protein
MAQQGRRPSGLISAAAAPAPSAGLCIRVWLTYTINSLVIPPRPLNLLLLLADITKEGPYIWTVVQGTTTCQRAQANGSSRPVQVPITVTTPAAATATSSVPPPPYPVCVLINGFQVMTFPFPLQAMNCRCNAIFALK